MTRALAILLWLVPAVAGAQEPLKCKRASGPITVTLHTSTTALDLSRWITAMTCKPVVMDAALGGRTVTVLAPGEMTPKQAIALFVDSLEAVDLIVKVKASSFVVTAKDRPCRVDKPVVDGGTGGTGVAEPADPIPPAIDYERHIKKIDDTHYQIDRALVDQLLGDPNAIARAARIVPALKNGKVEGFKLYAIRPGELWGRLGFSNGDTIHAVNGHEITTPEQALEVYTKIKSANKLAISLTRRGKPLTLEITIK